MRRIDAVVMQAVVVEYDEAGRPIGEALTTPLKIYRARLADLEAELAKLDAQLAARET